MHERACAALDLCQESQSVEFKESASWETLKWKIIKSILAMGNLRDGGIIVVGASERGNSWGLTGITLEHLATFDADILREQVNAYVSPYANIDIVLVSFQNETRFLAIQVSEFHSTPLVCKKNGPDGQGIREGVVYVRPLGVSKTTQLIRAEDMHDLLELASEKRARKMLETSRRIGLTGGTSDAEYFARELEGL